MLSANIKRNQARRPHRIVAEAAGAQSLSKARRGVRKWQRALLITTLWFSTAANACLSVTVGADDLDFGHYNIFDSAPVSATLNITVECITDGLLPAILTPYSVGINSAYSGDPANRQMKSGPHSLSYSIYQPNSMTSIWGPTSSGDIVSGLFDSILSPPPSVLTGVGVLPGLQDVPIGNYSDQLIVEVSF